MLAVLFHDFFIRALIAGMGVAAVTGPLGCFVIWRRLAYFGDTLAHAALLGVAFAFLLEVNITLSVFIVAVAVSLLLFFLQHHFLLAPDSVLGLLSHATLALGLVALGFIKGVQVDLFSFLLGDILTVSVIDISLIYSGGMLILGLMALLWKRLFAATVSFELAEAEGLNPQTIHIIFALLLALVIAIAMKIVGVLLITSLLIIPAATARPLAKGPEHMALIASLLGMSAVIMGMFGSLHWDTPTGPSIVVAMLVLFIISFGAKVLKDKWGQ